MILDEIDFKLLKIFHDLEEDEYTGTRLIARRIFPKVSENMLNSKDNLIRFRLRKMSESGLMSIGKNGKGRYVFTFNEEGVIFRKFRLPDRTVKDCLLIKPEGRWIIFELEKSWFSY